MSRTLLEEAIGTTRFARMLAKPTAFVEAFDREPYPYQQHALERVLDRETGDAPPLRFAHRIAVVSWPRQDGKSTLAGWAGLWTLFVEPSITEILSVSLDRESARIILNDARRIIRSSELLLSLVDDDGLTKNEIRLKDGTSWRIRSADAAMSRGYRPGLIIYDELGWAGSDDLWHTLLTSQAAQVNPLVIVASTVGPIQAGPLWDLFQDAERDDDILLLYANENRSPLVTQEFLESQRRRLPTNWFGREHENRWGSGTDVFATQEDWQRAINDGDPLEGSSTKTHVCFVDLGWIHDPSVIAVGRKDGEKVRIVHLETFEGSQDQPVSLMAVQHSLLDLRQRFNLTQTKIESPQGVLMVEQLQDAGMHVEAQHPTSKTQRNLWGALYQALKNGEVWLPKHERLRRQLLTLTIKETYTGWRVEDAPAEHQDHALAVGGVVEMLESDALPAMVFSGDGELDDEERLGNEFERGWETIAEW